MARGFRSEAVSHDFAVFLLIIAQLEVAALPESKEAYKIIKILWELLKNLTKINEALR